MCMRDQCCAYGTGFETAVGAVLCDTNFVKAISSRKQAVSPLETETVHGGALGCHFVIVNELTGEWQHFASKGLSDQSKIVFDSHDRGKYSKEPSIGAKKTKKRLSNLDTHIQEMAPIPY